MHLLAILLGCSGDTGEPGAVDPGAVRCSDGEIRVASTGAAHATLTEALREAADEDVVCIGAGTWNLAEDASCAAREAAFSGRALTVEGAGSEHTRLVGAGDACAELYFRGDRDVGHRALRGVTLWDAPVLFHDGAVSLSDVRVSGYAGDNRAIRVNARSLEVRDLAIAENVMDYGAGFELYADGTIEGMVVEGNLSEAGYVGEISGVVTWTGGRVSDNARTDEIPGYDFLETWGDVTLTDVTVSGNRANGPALTGHGRLALTDVSIVGNDSNWRGVLTVHDALVMSGGAITGNVGADGAVALYGAGEASLHGVDIEANAGCAVSGDGTCLATDPGAAASLDCDVSGCSP